MNRKILYSKTTDSYSEKVLIGEWFERRHNKVPPVPKNHDFLTVYRESFTPKPYSKWDSALMWDHLLKNEDSNFISQNECYESTNFFHKYSSTNDLAYNYFPKCVKKPIERKWRLKKGHHEPIDEFLPSFGNWTNFGLVKQKKGQWECDKDFRPFTSYEVDFRAPKPEDYKFEKFSFKKVNTCKNGNKEKARRQR